MRLSKRAHKIVAHLTVGPTIEGILLGKSKGHYVLCAASIEKDDETSYTLDGEIRIPKERLAFYQVVD